MSEQVNQETHGALMRDELERKKKAV